MKQSAYLIQQRETKRRLVQAAERVTQQLLLDLLRDHQTLIPFGERYPEIREITYGPRRAGKG